MRHAATDEPASIPICGGVTFAFRHSSSISDPSMPKVLDLLVRTRDKYPFDKLVSHKFKLADINQGIQQSLTGKVIRAGIVPD